MPRLGLALLAVPRVYGFLTFRAFLASNLGNAREGVPR